MVNRMRSNRSHTGNRRSHHALDDVRLSKCSNCASMHVRHIMCAKCGHYRGRKIIDMTAIVAKQTARDKRKAEAVK
ncbi:MAG TPA: 50S ribosomal protein L32 [Candidatus Paceibacterota bacterium]